MESTYDRWIHHGEALYPEPEPDAEAHHHGEDGPQQEDVGFEEEDGYEDDRVPDLFEVLYKSKMQGDGQNSIFSELVGEVKYAAEAGVNCQDLASQLGYSTSSLFTGSAMRQSMQYSVF
jgi:hypothetical protein